MIGASLTYVHESLHPTEADGQTLHAGNVEIYVGEDAKLTLLNCSPGENMSGISVTNVLRSIEMEIWIGFLVRLAAS